MLAGRYTYLRETGFKIGRGSIRVWLGRTGLKGGGGDDSNKYYKQPLNTILTEQIKIQYFKS